MIVLQFLDLSARMELERFSTQYLQIRRSVKTRQKYVTTGFAGAVEVEEKGTRLGKNLKDTFGSFRRSAL
jgi:hypothetical protein